MNRRQMATSMALGGAILAIGRQPAPQHSALAGGWASLEMINSLQVAVVGVPVVIDAQNLAHGVRPVASPGAIRFLNEESGDEQIARLEVISEEFAIVRGEVTLTEPGAYRMWTWEMGPEIDLGLVQAIEPGAGDVISTLRPDPGTEVARSGGETAEEVTTEILSMSFAEPVLAVPAGTTVTWINTTSMPHQISFRENAFNSSAMLHQDDTFSVTFAEAGEFEYFCAPHPSMVGIVSVGAGDA